MKLKESSLDFYAFINIFRDDIENSFIKKIYQVNSKEFIFQIYRSDVKKRDFFISLTKGISFYSADRPDEASQLAMIFRKQLSEKRITGIEQINFDRVIKITLHTGQEIILELFGGGNLILTENGKIVFAMDQHVYRTRTIKIGEAYVPPSLINPIENFDVFKKIVNESTASLVKTLATRVNLGGEIAEEVLYRLNMDKNLMPHQMDDKILNQVYEEINVILKESLENRAYYYKDEEILSPIILKSLKRNPDDTFENFNDGMVSYLNNYPVEEKNKSSVEKRIESQKKSIEEFKKLMEIYTEFGNKLKMNIPSIEKLIKIVNGKVKNGDLNGFDYGDLKILGINPAKKIFTIDYNNINIDLNYTLSAGNNISNVFNTAKDYKNKIEGAERAIEETKKLIIKEREKVNQKKRPRYWFETYRWFFSSNGNMVLSGKDAKTNEKLVKKHMEDNDIYVHADLYGAPSTVIKNDGIEISEETINEACQFAICMSRAWPAGISSGTAYWVYPNQVSKTPESGEFISKGSWVIRGKRNYVFNLPLELKISLIKYKEYDIPMISPSSTRVESEKWVKIRPGNEKRNNAVEKISKILDVPRDEIEPILPPGGSVIIETSREIKELG